MTRLLLVVVSLALAAVARADQPLANIPWDAPGCSTKYLRCDGTWVTVSGGGAPTDATYITQTGHASLSAEQILADLSTGICKVTTGTGVLSTAVAGDFPTLNQDTTGTAAALAANGANCGANLVARGVDAAGVAECDALADGDVPNTITVDLATLATTATTANAGDSATAFFSAGAIEDARIDAAISRDSEAVAAGDVTGSLSGGYQIGAGAVGTAELAAAHKTEQWAFTVYDPNGLAATDDIPSIIGNRARAVTITEVWCESNDGTGVINLQRDDGTPADILSANLTCTAGGATGTIAAAEDNIAVGNNIDLVFVSETAVTRLNVVLTYTVD